MGFECLGDVFVGWFCGCLLFGWILIEWERKKKFVVNILYFFIRLFKFVVGILLNIDYKYIFCIIIVYEIIFWCNVL